VSRLAYSLLLYLLAPVFCAVLLWRGLRERGYWAHFSERFGFGPVMPAGPIWVHAASMGEVQAASSLVRGLLQRYQGMPLLVTTQTPAGRERALSLFGEAVVVRFLPMDLPGAVRRFFGKTKPRIVVIFETELWPNLYHECGRRRIPLLLASARISPRSVERYGRAARLFRDALSGGAVVAAQAHGDAERFRAIGADPARTLVTGNIKFDVSVPGDVASRGRELRERHAPRRPVWVAGSTHAVEEQAILEAHRAVRRGTAEALLILVPRHPSRFAEVAEWLVREGVRFVRRSSDETAGPGTEVLLVDTLGELLHFYAMADVAFVGGSLVPVGGHNLLEPAALGLPILTGPHQFNGEEIAKLLIASGAVVIVADSSELARRVAALIADPGERARIGAAARDCVERNRGALPNLLGLIASLLDGDARSAR
jgi:3-deoxy-D-manno-octulosonic-acid transferase